MANLKRNEDTIKHVYACTRTGSKTILQRFEVCETYRNSQWNIGWTEGFCKHLDEIAQADHSYVAAWQERQRYEEVRKLSLKSQGPVGPVRSRAGYPEASRKLREVTREAAEAGHEFNPAIRPDLQSDNAKDNNSSSTKMSPQIMLLQNILLHGHLIRRLDMVAIS